MKFSPGRGLAVTISYRHLPKLALSLDNPDGHGACHGTRAGADQRRRQRGRCRHRRRGTGPGPGGQAGPGPAPARCRPTRKGTPPSPAANGAAPGQPDGPAGGQPDAGSRARAPAASRPRDLAPGLAAEPPAAAAAAPVPAPGQVIQGPEIDLASNDPLVGYLLSAAGAVDIRGLELDSPALAAMKDAGVVLTVPLISSGSLIGVISLGPRLSERDYSSEDRRLLNALAGYAAPAMRVGQLVRQQEAEARNRERIEQELKIAQIIQQQFLPKSVPDLPSWHVAAFYRPARTVGGDFYDFIPLPDGRVMFVVGDVTDKGIPAALVMASTHAPAARRRAAADRPRRGARARERPALRGHPGAYVRHLPGAGAGPAERQGRVRQRRSRRAIRAHRQTAWPSCGPGACRSG